MMKKYKRISSLVIFALSAMLFSPIMTIKNANAEEVVNPVATEVMEPRGIFTNLSLYLDGGNGTVSAIVKNQFTLLPAQVQVYVELYCADTYQESYENMELVIRNYTSDLNMGEKIYATASTNGESKYWMARMRSRLDNNAWEVTTTSTLLLDANGGLVE